MTCNENVFDVLDDEVQRRMGLTGATTQLALQVAAALDIALVGTGLAETGLGFDALENLQPELQASHEEYVNTSTDTRTQTRLNCQTTSAGSGRGTRTPDDVQEIINRNIETVQPRLAALTISVSEIGDAWKETLVDIHNCLESLIDEAMVIRKEPGPRKSEQRRVRVCDRFEGE